MRRLSIGLLGAVLLAALTGCGPAGVISGKVTVEGGSAGGIAVIVYGPQSAATVTNMDGTFSVTKVPDGVYVVRATVRGADVEEVSVSTTVTNGTAAPEPILAFRASTARITGKVVMSDGSGANDLTVTAVGPETAGTRTSADGSFTFENLKTGAYVVSVEGPDTREGRVAIGVNASGTGANTGDLRLTPVGRFGGTVLFNAMPVANAPVVVTGTNAASVTDATGRFSLVDVPTGNQAVSVRVGTAPFFRSATVMVNVLRGSNPDVPITLTDDAPRTGTVTGTVTFHGPRTPRDITVNALGTGVTATPQANGAYSLALPVGTWDVVANAPQHPVKHLGRVTVIEGQSQALPGAEVTWWRPVWTSNTTLPSGPTTVATGLNDSVPWSLVSFTDTSPRLALVNSTTYDFRILAAGTASGARISRAGKYAGWFVNSGSSSTVFVYEIGPATLTAFPFLTPAAPAQSVNRIEFSSDESAIFIVRTGVNSLTRIKFATPSNPETFPPGGASANSIQLTSVDRWFVRDSSNAVRLVTPAIDVASVFTNVSAFGASPTAWAFTNCAATCEVYVLSPTSTSPALRDTSINVVPNTYNNFQAYNYDNRGDYPCFGNGTAAFCVRSSDASHTQLAAFPTNFRLNEAGDRVIWTLPSGANAAVREEPMPPSPGTTNLGSNSVGWNIGWISPTRAYALENSGGPRTLHLVRAGTTMSETDVGSQAVRIDPPLLVFPQQSTSQWRAYLGDGSVRQIPVATNIPAVGTSVRPLSGGPTGLTRYGAVSFDNVNSFIVDETTMSVRQTAAGFAGSNGYRSGATEYFDLQRPGGASAYYVFNTNVLLEYSQPDVTLTAIVGAPGVQAWLGLDEDRRTISIGGFQP